MFLYFIETAETSPAAFLDPERVAAAGLEYAFDAAAKPNAVGTGAGPEGKQGVLLATPGVAMQPEGKTWRRVPGTEATWVGVDPENLPGPADLARVEQLAGVEVELFDGRRWLVPVGIEWLEQGDGPRWLPAVPMAAKLDDETGQWVPGDPKPKHQRLIDLALGWHTAYDASFRAAVEAAKEAGSPVEENDVVRFGVTHPNAIGDAVEVLAFNFRLGPAEADLLGLFDWQESNAGDVLSACGNMDNFRAALQKKTPIPDGGSATSAGEAA